MPAVAIYGDEEEILDDFLLGIYNTVIMKDIIQRNKVRDSALLENLIKFLAAKMINEATRER